MTASPSGPRSILITGASSGLGGALAVAYAADGVRLALGGRDAARLADVAQACRQRGADVETTTVDVVDREAMTVWVEAADRTQALDLIIANAGISGGTGGRGEDAAQTRAIMATNVDGVLNTILPAIPMMRDRGHGQVAMVSSLAGILAMPGAPAYSASKAAVRAWGESLRGWLGRRGIHVSVICPGFIDTPLTRDNRYAMPFLIDADGAARIIVRGLARNQAMIAFPWPMIALARFLAALPVGFRVKLLSRAPKKE
jgi:short-subunit dehydrogenase